MKKIVDERQEMEIYKAEHLGFNVMLYLLLFMIIIQGFNGVDFGRIAGEFIVLMVGSVIEIVAVTRKGNWSCRWKPGVRTYLITSLITGAAGGIIMVVTNLIRFENFRNGALYLILPIFGIVFMQLFALSYVLLAATGAIAKRREKKLEEEYEDDGKE